MSNNSVAAFAFLCIFGAPAGAIVIWRILAHRERMEMIRRGMLPSRGFRGKSDWNAGGYVPPQPPPGYPADVGPSDAPDRALAKGIRLALIGMALLIGLSFIGADNGGPLNTFEIRPGPWLLGGLIPMFVGIAQIIVAILGGARLGPGLRPPGPGPHTGPSVGPDARGFGPDVRNYGPEPRTHSGYEELKRPTPPPDRR